jgi:protein phosphatase
MAFTYSMIAATDIGHVRAVNEDSLRVIPSINLAVVADGMGGHKAGDIASRTAVNSLCEHFQEQVLINDALGDQGTMDVMADAFSLANSQVFTNSHQFSNCEGMGTTLISASCQPEQIQFGHIGDSRAYRFCRGHIEQLTIDHTLATELSVDTPEWELPAYSHHVLRKALGIESSCKPDFFTVKPENSEIFLLCSDGLTGVLKDEEISTILALRSHQPEHCLQTLIDACLDGGAPDNISIILIYVSGN